MGDLVAGNAPVASESRLSGQVYNAMIGAQIVGTLVSSFVLALRIRECKPTGESKNEENERMGILSLSGGALILCVVMAGLAASKITKYQSALESLFLVLSFIVVVLNFSYLRSAKLDSCPGADGNLVAGLEVMANKNLAVFVLVMSGVSLVMLVKRALYAIAGMRK